MFTIDLLKGQGLPIKSRPEGIAIAVVTLAVPVISAIVIFGCYLSNSIDISTQKQAIINYEAKIGELSDAVELQRSFKKEKSIISNSLSEVKSSIGRHTQWSPVLATLAKNMPNSVVLTKLEVKQHFIKRRVPGKDDPKKKVNITVPVRTLRMVVCGGSRSNCDKEVKDFQDRLRLSPLLGPRLEDIRISQGFGTLEGRDVVSYEINCIFKPGL